MDDDRIDFAALDPSTDSPRWERAIATVVARARARRAHPFGRELVRTGRFAFALAAAAALAVWIGGRAAPTPAASSSGEARDPANRLADWALGAEPVDPATLLELGADQ